MNDIETDIEDLAQIIAGQALRIEALEAALKPFSDIDGEDSVDYPDDTKCTVKFGRCTYYPLTLGDLRRARAALEKDTGK